MLAFSVGFAENFESVVLVLRYPEVTFRIYLFICELMYISLHFTL